MSKGPCERCSGYPLEVILADWMDPRRACLCFDPPGFVYDPDEEPTFEERVDAED